MKLSKPRKSTHSVRSLKRKADKAFSEFFRQRGADWRGNNRCFTCQKIYHWKSLQCGHYITRSENNLRYDPDNAVPQCLACNVFKHGNFPLFSLLMEKREKGITKKLWRKSQKAKRWTIKELEEVLEKFSTEK